ncbi:hypothetical protein AVEN_69846-1 [Araneus ventricosus]|uniref:Uncharacterized protein n=1 Tax=Araneus ventricosus TaxID=182803 RepID=A0A4Y2KDW4_ARAVE|nr:hypothetical protein AVEN_69846-1 [Araneus ventricosus]
MFHNISDTVPDRPAVTDDADVHIVKTAIETYETIKNQVVVIGQDVDLLVLPTALTDYMDILMLKEGKGKVNDRKKCKCVRINLRCTTLCKNCRDQSCINTEVLDIAEEDGEEDNDIMYNGLEVPKGTTQEEGKWMIKLSNLRKPKEVQRSAVSFDRPPACKPTKTACLDWPHPINTMEEGTRLRFGDLSCLRTNH